LAAIKDSAESNPALSAWQGGIYLTRSIIWVISPAQFLGILSHVHEVQGQRLEKNLVLATTTASSVSTCRYMTRMNGKSPRASA
jgi:hypothetical protein